MAQLPRVSVIIPTRNRAELLRKCLEGLSRTDYPDREIIVVDNDSDEPEALSYFEELRNNGVTVIRLEGEFNYSALNNNAAGTAQGEFLCFLNNDVEIVEPDWLRWLISRAARPDIGAVGARLLYPDGTLQHAGVFIGIGGGAAHAHRFLKADERGYFDRSRLPQRVSAVTGACLVVSREKFIAVGGFDEKNFRVAFNDIDLCLKLNRRDWQSFYEPRATLIHHESKSRGSDKEKVNRARFADELSALKRIWHTDKQTDPFHHPQLSQFCEQFVIAV
jgi:GT2 family glycosyltransferase